MHFLPFLKTFFFHPCGVDVRKYPDWILKSKINLLNANKISTIIDVGANIGQYATQVRSLGFNGRIISIEPQKKEFDILRAKTQRHNNWDAINVALGDYDGDHTINIASNSYSSSMLDINSAGGNLFNYVDKQNVTVARLDSIYDDLISPTEKVFLKVDVQGFEQEVIKGAYNSLRKIAGVQLEVSHFENYKGEMLFTDTLKEMEKLNFSLHAISPELFNSNDGKQLQSDCIFFKNTLAND